MTTATEEANVATEEPAANLKFPSGEAGCIEGGDDQQPVEPDIVGEGDAPLAEASAATEQPQSLLEVFDEKLAAEAAQSTTDDESHEPAIADEDAKYLFKLRDDLRDLQIKEADIAEAHKAAKKRTEAKQDELNKFIDDLEHPTPTLPFKQAAAPAAKEEISTEAASPPSEQPAPEVDDESWRKVTVKDLGISDAIGEKLAANEPMLTTLGEIVDYTTAGKRLTDIAGIGAAKAEAIDEAITKYFADHPRPAPKRDESWRATMLSEIGVTGEQAEAFWNHEPPMGTLGEIADWLDRDGNKLSNIGALEESTIKKVLKAIETARE